MIINVLDIHGHLFQFSSQANDLPLERTRSRKARDVHFFVNDLNRDFYYRPSAKSRRS